MSKQGLIAVFLVAIIAGGVLLYYTEDECIDCKREQTMEELAALSYVVWSEASNPENSDVTILSEEAGEGFNLYNSRPRNEAFIIDMNGKVLHDWQYTIGSGGWHHIELDKEGNLYVIVKNNFLLKLDWNSNLLWSSRMQAHHDMALANDQLYVIADSIGYIEHNNETVPIRDDNILVLTTEGELIRNISVNSMLGELIPTNVRNGAYYSYLRKTNKTKAMTSNAQYDVFHTNSIEFIEEDIPGVTDKESFLVCARNLNLIFILDLDTEEVLWSWGTSELDLPHNPTLTSRNTILVFDNGARRGYSRIVEVDPVTNEIIWEYYGNPEKSFFSQGRGGIQELSSGNLLITESNEGHVFEIDRNGTILWEFWNPDIQKNNRAAIYRMTRVEGEDIPVLLEIEE